MKHKWRKFSRRILGYGDYYCILCGETHYRIGRKSALPKTECPGVSDTQRAPLDKPKKAQTEMNYDVFTNKHIFPGEGR